MKDNMRGAAAIVGIGELTPERTRPCRDAMSLLAEAAYLAIQEDNMVGVMRRKINISPAVTDKISATTCGAFTDCSEGTGLHFGGLGAHSATGEKSAQVRRIDSYGNFSVLNYILQFATRIANLCLISVRLRYFPMRTILFLVGLTAIVSGCTTALEVFTISSTSEAVIPAYGRKDYGQALAAIASTMSRDFNLPVVDVLVEVYPSKASFESGAIAEGLRQRERLQQRGLKVLSEEEYTQRSKILAVSSYAIGGYRSVLVDNSRASKQRWDAWVALLAHELTHSAQNELARGGPSSSDRWLNEGFAEWVGFQVADKLKAGNFAEARQRVVDRIAIERSYQTFPSLNQLVTSSDWIRWVRTLGRLGTYEQSFLAVDVLIEEKGIQAMAHYFSLFGRANNRELNFLTAFGEPLKSFVERFDKRLQVLD